MPNPKFNKAFYICYNASNKSGDIHPTSQSFYHKTTGFNSIFEKKTINFAINFPRKLVPNRKPIPTCLINFAFDGRDGRFKRKSLNISNEKTNTQIAKEILKDYLKDVVPYSVIYINAHGAPPKNLQQQILNSNHKLVACYLTVDYLAELMAEYIPKHAQNNLKIHLLMCDGDQICKNFMVALNSKGFYKTSVVGYIGTLVTMEYTNKMLDFSTEERPQEGFIFKHGKNYPENKFVSHNYIGVVKTEFYKNFKQKYLLPSLEEKDKEKEKKKHLLRLIDKLIKDIGAYIAYNEQANHGFFHFHHKHGRSGRDRARCISEALINIKDEINSTIPLSSNFEIRLINELRSFANKTGSYKKFSGSINIHHNSCLSYILRALNSFYNDFGRSIQSSILKEFVKYLSQRKQEVRPTTIFRTGGNDDKAERTRLKNRLIDLKDNTINSWNL
ncbi:hypothetical protein [Francisella sp. SYW-9]|uniref:hypothetical protein n=1 Tax=Francisella sp. SYW-9 TaxID=2610888 RepID=UPI00123D0A2D|nr:hypothetical protein [Francisella sp. SYW-9]